MGPNVTRLFSNAGTESSTPDELDRAQAANMALFDMFQTYVKTLTRRIVKERPHRDGYFVEAIQRTGRLNPGLCYRLTDGHGTFWECGAESVQIVEQHHQLQHRIEEIERVLEQMGPPYLQRVEGA